MSDIVERLKGLLGEDLAAPAADIPQRSLAGHALGTPRARRMGKIQARRNATMARSSSLRPAQTNRR